jgi:ParB family chromosome partitioning protein
MRHDGHFVEIISERTSGPSIRMISIVKIKPNPHQARNELGNIKELVASIREKGVLEPILVRPKDGKYEIIAGERRYMAAKTSGLEEMPCIEMNIEDNEAMEISLIENLQRKDLNVFEEADGLNSLADMYGYNHSQIAEKIGKARSTITEIINLSKIPIDIRDLCRKNSIKSRTTLIEISKQKSKKNMSELIKAISERDLKREDTRILSKKIKGKEESKIKRYVYNFIPTIEKNCMIRIEFKKQKVNKSEIISILKEAIEKLKRS